MELGRSGNQGEGDKICQKEKELMERQEVDLLKKEQFVNQRRGRDTNGSGD